MAKRTKTDEEEKKEKKETAQEVSMNPDLLRKWRVLVLNSLIYDDATTSHGTNQEIFFRFAALRKAAGIPSKASIWEKRAAEKMKGEAEVKLESLRIERALLAEDNRRIEASKVSGKKLTSSTRVLKNYDIFSVGQLKDLLKSRSIVTDFVNTDLLLETRKWRLVHALRKADAEKADVIVPDED
jgi:hypothetical protein